MIHIEIKKQDGRICRLTSKGHAGYDDIGKDLVCAGISSILFGALNGLDEMFAADVKLDVNQNRIQIDVCNDSEDLQNTLQFLVIQLKTVEQRFPEFVKIVQKEV